jgi:hypothetical protein
MENEPQSLCRQSADVTRVSGSDVNLNGMVLMGNVHQIGAASVYSGQEHANVPEGTYQDLF